MHFIADIPKIIIFSNESYLKLYTDHANYYRDQFNNYSQCIESRTLG